MHFKEVDLYEIFKIQSPGALCLPELQGQDHNQPFVSCIVWTSTSSPSTLQCGIFLIIFSWLIYNVLNLRFGYFGLALVFTLFRDGSLILLALNSGLNILLAH